VRAVEFFDPGEVGEVLGVFGGVDFVVEDWLDVDLACYGVAVGVFVAFELGCWTGGFWAGVFGEGGRGFEF
jgi:hypothetical protein